MFQPLTQGLGFLSDEYEYSPPADDWWNDLWCEDCSEGGGGGFGPGVDLPTGGGVNWFDLWSAAPTPLPWGGYAGDTGGTITTPWDWTFAPGVDNPPGSQGFFDWVNNWLHPDPPGTSLDPIPIDWDQIGTSIGGSGTPCNGTIVYTTNGERCVENYLATRAAVCGGGTYNDPADPSRCIPFPPDAPEAKKNQLRQQGQNAANAANAKASQQQQLQSLAQQCAARGGKLVQGQDGKLQCVNANGQPMSGLPSWLIYALIALGVVVVLK